MKRALLIVFVVAILAAAAYAQMHPGQQPGPMPNQPLRVAPVPPVMLADKGFLYILRGDQLLKVNGSSLEVETVKMLPRPERPKPPPGQ